MILLNLYFILDKTAIMQMQTVIRSYWKPKFITFKKMAEFSMTAGYYFCLVIQFGCFFSLFTSFKLKLDSMWFWKWTYADCWIYTQREGICSRGDWVTILSPVSFTFRKCYSTFRERKKKYKHGKVYIIIRNRKTFNFFIFTYF